MYIPIIYVRIEAEKFRRKKLKENPLPGDDGSMSKGPESRESSKVTHNQQAPLRTVDL